MTYQLNDRDKSILGAIIQEYVATGEPVGSRVVAKKYLLTLSPATVRNVMADLEEIGFLYQPHISAGRIPTPEGFRCYLNDIMEVKTLQKGEKSLIARHMSRTVGDVRETLKEASSLLSQISRNASIIILPKLDTFLFKRIDFVRLDESRILVILVSRSGMVFNHIVQGEDVAQDLLTRYANYLNETFTGRSIQEMRDSLIHEMSSEKARFDSLVKKAIGLGMTALDGVEGVPDIYIQGKESVFNSPELASLGKLRDIVNAFEDKGRIVRILNRVLEDAGVKVLLGEDMQGLGMDDFSMVASRYYRRDVPVGSLGVIGPIRMDYSRVIPLVGYMAKILSDLLEDV
ncbi:MAG TPA: heat-inducible transcriptional repressor HrcA [Deltaproteobacteria bacterium]|jgi:heat-inducible transcriptional repressor|nr:heat-inducible transcriptional repressor HrcA [Pseudomonadota bacterium]HNR51763.1 heat-inducible transcriptional repressor HrcA [Deltaproteobacteria bacterium]HRR21439.1 heat-inducible transcriptional repressor HrcA [Desulfomonilia bacterium]HPA86124.1 heat-inducible transcriptional repressor HrcA [Deltaproteobacteria bacterium]HPX48915.1 heat-inducible transcriptional repressor HrcA [Deltaproteobacteria bacterium]